jgi:hypothetical protein
VKYIKESMICLGIITFLKQNKKKLIILYNEKQIKNILKEQLFEDL